MKNETEESHEQRAERMKEAAEKQSARFKIQSDPEQQKAIQETLRKCATNIVASHAETLKQEKLSTNAAQRAIDAALNCGRNLICAKETGKQYKGFKFLKWVKENCKFDERTAQRYMTMAKNPTHVSDSELREKPSLTQAMVATGAIKPTKKENTDPVVQAYNWVSSFIPKLVKVDGVEQKKRMLKALGPLRATCDEWEKEIAQQEKRAEEDKAFDSLTNDAPAQPASMASSGSGQ